MARSDEIAEKMSEFLIAKLANPAVYGVKENLINDKRVHYVKGTETKEGDSIIFLLSEDYTLKNIKKLTEMTRENFSTVKFLFLKDQRIYFRSPFSDKNSLEQTLKKASLQDYSAEEKQRMISFTPAESFVYNLTNNGANQQISLISYYQPESTRLKETILEYAFNRVLLKPLDKSFDNYFSKKLHIYKQKIDLDQKIHLFQGNFECFEDSNW